MALLGVKLLIRRRLPCTMDLVFQAVVGREKHAGRDQDRRRPAERASEHWLPVACANLRATPSTRIFASDASSWGEALAHSAKAGQDPIVASRKGLHRLHPELELPEGVEQYKMNPTIWQVLASCLRYRIFHKERSSSKRRINFWRVEGVLKAEWKAGLSRHVSRMLYGSKTAAAGCPLRQVTWIFSQVPRELPKHC